MGNVNKIILMQSVAQGLTGSAVAVKAWKIINSSVTVNEDDVAWFLSSWHIGWDKVQAIVMAISMIINRCFITAFCRTGTKQPGPWLLKTFGYAVGEATVRAHASATARVPFPARKLIGVALWLTEHYFTCPWFFCRAALFSCIRLQHCTLYQGIYNL